MLPRPTAQPRPAKKYSTFRLHVSRSPPLEKRLLRLRRISLSCKIKKLFYIIPRHIWCMPLPYKIKKLFYVIPKHIWCMSLSSKIKKLFSGPKNLTVRGNTKCSRQWRNVAYVCDVCHSTPKHKQLILKMLINLTAHGNTKCYPKSCSYGK